jgi:hypothetical protein
MRKINKVLIGLTVVGAGFATVGAGAGADFVTSPTASQTINTGTLTVSLSDGTNTVNGTVDSPAALTLAAIGPTGSSFSDYKTITAKNTGNVTATVTNLQLTTSGDVTPLANDVHISVAREDSVYVCSGSVAHCTGVNLTPGGSYVLAPGASLIMHISTYAGGASGAPALTNADEGKSLTDTLTYTISG